MLGIDENKDLNYKFIRSVKHGRIDITKKLLSEGADVNTKGKILKETALQIAAKYGDKEMVKLLLTQPNIKVDFESLYNALHNGFGAVAIAILNRNPKLAKVEIDGENAMHSSVLTGDAEMIPALISLLIKYGADINHRDEKEGLTALHLAAHHGLRDVCAELLKQERIKVDILDKGGFTPLHHAASTGEIECCRILLEKGADAEKTVKGKTIIDLCDNLYPNKVELLKNTIKEIKTQKLGKRKALSNKSNNGGAIEEQPNKKVRKWTEEEDNIQRNNEISALDLANQNDHTETVNFLQDRQAEFNPGQFQNDEEYDEMHVQEDLLYSVQQAIYNDNLSKFNNLINDKNFNPNYKSFYDEEEKKTLLYYAVRQNSFGMVKTLIDKGADIYSNGEPLLCEAVMNNNIHMVLLLINAGIKIDRGNLKEGYGDYTPLYYAARDFNLTLFETLLASGASYFFSDVKFDAYIPYVTEKPVMNIIKKAYNKDKIDQSEYELYKRALKRTEDAPPIHQAIMWGIIEEVEQLINQGQIHDINNYGETPLHIAIIKRNIPLIELLISKGADVNAQDADGLTPLHFAVRREDNDIVNYLLNRGADVNIRDTNGLTPLYFAITRKVNEEIVQDLLDQGANINVTDKNGLTPLHRAVIEVRGEEEIRYLLDKGADVNAKDIENSTPLHYAARQGYITTSNLLLQFGADINLKNNNGKTAFQLASTDLLKNYFSTIINRIDQVKLTVPSLVDLAINKIKSEYSFTKSLTEIKECINGKTFAGIILKEQNQVPRKDAYYPRKSDFDNAVEEEIQKSKMHSSKKSDYCNVSEEEIQKNKTYHRKTDFHNILEEEAQKNKTYHPRKSDFRDTLEEEIQKNKTYTGRW